MISRCFAFAVRGGDWEEEEEDYEEKVDFKWRSSLNDLLLCVPMTDQVRLRARQDNAESDADGMRSIGDYRRRQGARAVA